MREMGGRGERIDEKEAIKSMLKIEQMGGRGESMVEKEVHVED